jgi:putative ABC transport system ATP-binding protein
VDPNLFRYIWTHSRREQITILILIAASLPFYWLSLDVPKRIVNEALGGEAFRDGKTHAKLFEIGFSLPDILGGGSYKISDGVAFDQIGYLLALSFMFLGFVLVNGFFKYKINIDKGVLAERLLRRLRFDLFTRMMHFRPEAMRAVKPAEAATVINNEVEPIGAFSGDAFIWPVFLATQALTALLFILMQSFWLGAVALAIVLVQAFIIPALRRKQLEYARQRQIAARQLSGRIGEMVDGAPMIHGHGIVDYTQSEIGARLGHLFGIRVKLYNRKYSVKYLNTLLAQITPFFFYAIGGYFALTGSLDLGQLVAVIAAYKDLPPPIKELIDWDQRRADTTIKYQQVLSQFGTERLMPQPAMSDDEAPLPAPDAPLRLSSVQLLDQRGNPLLESLSLTLERPAHVALVGPNGSSRDVLARLLGRQVSEYEGTIQIGHQDLWSFSDAAAARFLGYVSPEAYLFPGTLRDNVTISLQRCAPSETEPADADEVKARVESLRTGNPLHAPDADWCDWKAAGLASRDQLEQAIINALRITGLDADIYAFGLLGQLEPDTEQEVLDRIVRARRLVREKLEHAGLLNLVEPFDPHHYNKNASIGENLIFGLPAGSRLKGRGLSSDPFFRSILSAEALDRPLAEIGTRIAETTIETFAELPPGHPLFERYSLIQTGELEEYAEILERTKGRDVDARLSHDDVNRLIALALGYIEPRHRLSQVGPLLEQRILRARHSFKRYLPGDYSNEIEFYDPDVVMKAAPVRDNLLFGRIAYGIANSERKVADVLREALEELDLINTIYHLGLDYDVGPGGKLLFAPQRAAVNIARSLICRPDILIVDGSLSEFGAADAARLLEGLHREMAGRTLIVSMSDEEMAQSFDRIIRFEGVRVTDYGTSRTNEKRPGTERATATHQDRQREQA